MTELNVMIQSLCTPHMTLLTFDILMKIWWNNHSTDTALSAPPAAHTMLTQQGYKGTHFWLILTQHFPLLDPKLSSKITSLLDQSGKK